MSQLFSRKPIAALLAESDSPSRSSASWGRATW